MIDYCMQSIDLAELKYCMHVICMLKSRHKYWKQTKC